MTRKTRLIIHDGHVDTLAGWAAKIGISREALDQRLRHGWSEAEAVTTKRRGRTPKRLRRAQTQPNEHRATTSAPVNLQLEDLKRQHLAVQRQFNSLLRQFNRDLHTLMSRSLDRGVGLDLSDLPFDRSLPVTRSRV